jgi:Ran GTPase-activating protein (RanGAP) involved in mRNA processing and transport
MTMPRSHKASEGGGGCVCSLHSTSEEYRYRWIAGLLWSRRGKIDHSKGHRSHSQNACLSPAKQPVGPHNLCTTSCRIVAVNRHLRTEEVLYGCSALIEHSLASIHPDIQQLSITSRRIDRRVTSSLSRVSLENLTHLTLSENQLYRDPRRVRLFLSAIPTATLQHLDLSWNGLTAKQIAHLARTGLSRMQLKSIRLSGNPLGEKGIKVLLDEGNVHRIPDIDLWDCDVGDAGAQLIGRAMHRSDAQIQRLVLNMNGIGNPGVEYLAGGITSCGSLTSLDVGCNNIGFSGVAALSKALQNSNVEKLNLRANQLGVVGAKLLASVVNVTRLRQLDVCYNGIGDDGARYLGEALETNTFMEELSISSNDLTSRSARSLARTLECNTTLKRLYMDGNMIGRRDAVTLATALQIHNLTLTDLALLETSYENHLMNNKLALYLDANACGRRFWGDITVPISTWLATMQIMSPTCLYWFLQERPDIARNGHEIIYLSE